MTRRSHRRWGFGLVLLMHVLGIILLRQDRWLATGSPPAPTMLLLRLPASPPPPAPIAPPLAFRPWTPSTPLPPLEALPMVRVTPESKAPAEAPLFPRGLDLSTHPAGPGLERLLPSPEARRRQFFADQAKENDRLNEDPRAASKDDCVLLDPSRPGVAGAVTNGIAADHIPETVCAPRRTLRDLQDRNDLYSPK